MVYPAGHESARVQLDRTIEHDVMDVCKELGVAVIAYSPLGHVKAQQIPVNGMI